MRLYSIVTTLLFAVISSGIMAQNTLSNLRELTNFVSTDYSYNQEQRERNTTIEGTPYLDDEFTGGQLVYQDKLYKNLELRYNVYEGHFEFKSEGEVLYFDPRFTEVDTVWIGDEKFIYALYAENNREKRSYMRLLYDGKTQVLTLMETILLEAKKAQGYQDASPASFRELPERLFVSIDGRPAVEFTNRRSIDDVFPKHADKLTAYAKRERLRFKSTDDLLQLVKYYDTLR